MMGFGAIFAGGCNIGQGLSGVSTLSVTSLLAAASIFFRAALGVNWPSRRVAAPIRAILEHLKSLIRLQTCLQAD